MHLPRRRADRPWMAWWYLDEGRPTGPVDDETIRSLAGRGELSATSLIYADDSTTWEDLSTFEIRFGLHRNPLGHYVIPVVEEEGEFPEGPPAGCWRRFAAHMIDNMVLRTVGGIAGIVILPWALRAGPERLLIASIVLGTIITAGYETVLVAVRGQTVGKGRLGIEIVDARTGALLTLPRALARSVVAAIAFPISALLIFLPGNPTVHDWLVGSRVQRVG